MGRSLVFAASESSKNNSAHSTHVEVKKATVLSTIANVKVVHL
jgi:hypothetical protein